MNKYLTLLAISATCSTQGMELHMTLDDLVSNAHVVVLGRCTSVIAEEDPERPHIIGSTASFADVEVVRELVPGTAPGSRTMQLHYLGGEAGGFELHICSKPEFEVGETYLMFLLNDGSRYVSPLIGGSQGSFRIMHDRTTGVPYPIKSSGHAVMAVLDGELIGSSHPVQELLNGVPVLGPEAEQHPVHEDVLFDQFTHALSLEELIDQVMRVTFDHPSLWDWEGGGMPTVSLPADTTPTWTAGAPAAHRDPLGACRHQDVYIWFEENDLIPGYAVVWAPLEDQAKAIYDKHMNIFSDTPNPTDGFGAGNGEDEVAGWLSSSQLNAYYGHSWGSALAICATWSSGSEIVEADIVMNAAKSWTTDWNTAFGSSLINYRNVIMHEFGHAWGYQVGSCHDESYDYGQPSVMHAYYSDLWEDGREIHAKDAQVIRALYDDQTTVRNVVDLGVETYRAIDGTGLVNAYLSDYTVAAGYPLSIHRITLENMSNSSRSNIHLRFYLSTNRNLGSADRLVADHVRNSLSAAGRVVSSYSLDTDGVPPGLYYVGVKVTHNGYNDDDRSANDVTWTTNQVRILSSVGMEEQERPTVLVAPVPTQGPVSIRTANGRPIERVELFEMSGRRVEPEPVATSGGSVARLDLGSLPQGVYVARVWTDAAMPGTARLILQH